MNPSLRALLVPILLIGLLFGAAGRLDLPWLWVYTGVIVSATLIGPLLVSRELIRERVDPAPGGIDRRLRLWAAPFLFIHLIVAGWDVGRYHWSDTVPWWLHVVALPGLVLGFALATWAMRVNRFFSPVVRIQSERGHHVISHGPYAWIRHPGYLGSICMFPCGGLVLGSWWSLVPLAVPLALILRRAYLEDRYLREELEGYADYAKRVRYGLVPLVW